MPTAYSLKRINANFLIAFTLNSRIHFRNKGNKIKDLCAKCVVLTLFLSKT